MPTFKFSVLTSTQQVAVRKFLGSAIGVQPQAIGDLTTNDYTALAAKVALIDPNRGGPVYFPEALGYRIGTNLALTVPGTELIGEGIPGIGRDTAKGSTRIVSDNGITAITYNPGGSPSHHSASCILRQLHVYAATGATTGNGFLAQNAEQGLIESCAFSDYIAGFGCKIDGTTGGNAQYWSVRDTNFGDNLISLHVTGPGANGLSLYGGVWNGNFSDSPRAGSIGIFNDGGGDTFVGYGPKIHTQETGAWFNSVGGQQALYGARFEVNRTHVRLGPNTRGFGMYGGAIGRGVLASPTGDIGIRVEDGASGIFLAPNDIEGVSTGILVESGVSGVVIWATDIRDCTIGIQVDAGATNILIIVGNMSGNGTDILNNAGAECRVISVDAALNTYAGNGLNQSVEDTKRGVSGSFASTMRRLDIVGTGVGPMITQRLYMAAVYLPVGVTVANLTWYSGSTAAGTPVNQWAALFSAARVKLAISADATTGAWAANTAKTFAMTTPYVTPSAGLYYVGVMVNATTVPNLKGNGASASANGPRSLAPVECGVPSDTGLTNPASCPSTTGAISVTDGFAYAEVS